MEGTKKLEQQKIQTGSDKPCPKCNGKTYTEYKGKHLGWYCYTCGYIKFLSGPWQEFVMPIGKYKGKKLTWIRKNDTPYMLWCRDNMSSKSIRRKCAQALDVPIEEVE